MVLKEVSAAERLFLLWPLVLETAMKFPILCICPFPMFSLSTDCLSFFLELERCREAEWGLLCAFSGVEDLRTGEPYVLAVSPD